MSRYLTSLLEAHVVGEDVAPEPAERSAASVLLTLHSDLVNILQMARIEDVGSVAASPGQTERLVCAGLALRRFADQLSIAQAVLQEWEAEASVLDLVQEAAE